MQNNIEGKSANPEKYEEHCEGKSANPQTCAEKCIKKNEVRTKLGRSLSNPTPCRRHARRVSATQPLKLHMVVVLCV